MKDLYINFCKGEQNSEKFETLKKSNELKKQQDAASKGTLKGGFSNVGDAVNPSITKSNMAGLNQANCIINII